jgi:hypothetical protein
MKTLDNVMFDDTFHGQGWFPEEHLGEPEEKKYYRWMLSGGSAKVTLISSTKFTTIASCKIVSILQDDILEYLQITIDHKPVEFIVTRCSGFLYSLEFVIPIRSNNPIVNVEFTVDKVFTPEGGDARNLSLAFHQILVGKVSAANILPFYGFKPKLVNN